MEKVIVGVVGAYHVLLVVVFAYLFFEIWPAPWPPPPSETLTVAGSAPTATQSAQKDHASASKDPVGKAPETKSVTAEIAKDVLAAQTRTGEEAKYPKKYAVSLFWGCITFFASFEQRLILIVLIAGGLGAYIHAASSLADFVGNQQFQLSWTLWYLLRPFIGMALAIVLYAVFRAGFLSASAASSEVVNVYGITAIAAMAGLFSKQAADKLNEIFTTAFRTASGGDEDRKHKLEKNSVTISAITPDPIPKGTQSLVITGSGFVTGAICKFNGAQRPATFKSATELVCVLDASDTATAGPFHMTVQNPGGKPVSKPVTVQ